MMIRTYSIVIVVLLFALTVTTTLGFTVVNTQQKSAKRRISSSFHTRQKSHVQNKSSLSSAGSFKVSTPLRNSLRRSTISSSTSLNAFQQDLDVIALVAGQENYGLAIVCVGEALWSFLSAPSLDHIKVLIPAAIAAAVLVLLSGPMITSGDVSVVGTGLWIATATSIGLGVSYIARLIAPYSPSSKEIAALGLLVAIAGFFSFAQNLFVDGFITLPSLPTLPSIELPNLSGIFDDTSSQVLPTVDIPSNDVIPTSDALPALADFSSAEELPSAVGAEAATSIATPTQEVSIE